MATKNNDESSDAGGKKKKSKASLLIIIFAVVALIAAVGFGVLFYLGQQNSPEAKAASQSAKKAIPVYLALDNMVVNLADPGGEKIAQVGVTLELVDSKASDKVKVYLPSIRSSILLIISQRESTELLSIAGKEKLAADILLEVLRPFSPDNGASRESGAPEKESKTKKKTIEKPSAEEGIVNAVHFSSFIVQ